MSNDIVSLVNDQEDYFTPALATDKMKWQQESQFAIQAFQKNDFLAKMALQNKVSAQNAIINVAAIGITLNPASKLAYLVPRQGGVCLDISYMGLIHLAQDAGSIEWCQADIVYKNDTYKRQGVDKAPLHDYEPFGDRGEAVGAYCVVKTSSGDYLAGEMSADEIHAIRNRSESFKRNSGPWVTDKFEMWKKTVVKRESKYWPKSERLDKAIHHLNENGEGIEMEPVMGHTSQQEIDKNSADDYHALVEQVNTWIADMNNCNSFESLKGVFATAYTSTKQNQNLSQQIQQSYAQNKARVDKGVIEHE